jgi:hypothetical protein
MTERKSRREIQGQLIARAMKDEAFRQELISDPRGVLGREFGVTIPETVQVSVLEESPQNVYLVLPPAPPSTGGGLSDQDLEGVAGGFDTDFRTYCGGLDCP